MRTSGEGNRSSGSSRRSSSGSPAGPSLSSWPGARKRSGETCDVRPFDPCSHARRSLTSGRSARDLWDPPCERRRQERVFRPRHLLFAPLTDFLLVSDRRASHERRPEPRRPAAGAASGPAEPPTGGTRMARLAAAGLGAAVGLGADRAVGGLHGLVAPSTLTSPRPTPSASAPTLRGPSPSLINTTTWTEQEQAVEEAGGWRRAWSTSARASGT